MVLLFMNNIQIYFLILFHKVFMNYNIIIYYLHLVIKNILDLNFIIIIIINKQLKFYSILQN